MTWYMWPATPERPSTVPLASSLCDCLPKAAFGGKYPAKAQDRHLYLVFRICPMLCKWDVAHDLQQEVNAARPCLVLNAASNSMQ